MRLNSSQLGRRSGNTHNRAGDECSFSLGCIPKRQYVSRKRDFAAGHFDGSHDQDLVFAITAGAKIKNQVLGEGPAGSS